MVKLKKICALLLAVVVMFPSISVFSADSAITISLDGEVSCETPFLVASSDKYIFAATGTSAALAYEIKVLDKESLEIIGTITHKSPSTIYLRVQSMYVKGDYLYVTFVQRKANGNPCICKYNIRTIHKGTEITPELTVGARPNAFSYIDDEILCRTDSGYVNITFMDTDTLTDKSAIGVSEENVSTLKSYKGLYIHNKFLFAYTSKKIYVYDASSPLKGVSKNDAQVLKGQTSLGYTINGIRGYKNYLYVATERGVFVIKITDDGEIESTTQITSYFANSLEINNGYLYLAESTYFKIYSLKSPLNPSLVYTSESGWGFNAVNLRPGKIYSATAEGIAVYDINGIDIIETVIPGTSETVKEITYNQTLKDFDNVKDICAADNYLFVLTGADTINVVRSDTLEKVLEIYKEENGTKLEILDFGIENEWLWVSYNGALRKYNISEMNAGTIPSAELVVPMFSDMSSDTASHIIHSEKYIFVAATSSLRHYLANSKVFVFDKLTGEYLTSLHLDSGNANYDASVRNMWVVKNRLYVTWNNAKTAKNYLGSLASLMPDGATRYQSPLLSYDISNISYGETLSPTFVTHSADITKLAHPYNRGGNSYFDEENKVLYQGIYTQNNGQCYEAYDVSTDSPRLIKKWCNGSLDCVSFFVKDGYLYEILSNNAGLLVEGVTTQEHNKVLKYNISENSLMSDDLAQSLCGSYQTSVYGSSAISQIAVSDANIYIATTSGIEVVDKAEMKLLSTVGDTGNVYSLKIEGGVLFAAASNGLYLYDIAEGITLLEHYTSSASAFSVNSQEGKIYITTSQADGYGKILNYDQLNSAVSSDTRLILENIDYTDTVVSEEYVFAYNKDSENIIYVYNRKTGLKTGEIDTGQVKLSDIVIYGNHFYTFNGKSLNVYEIPSTSSKSELLLKGTVELSGNITGLDFNENVLFAATEKGVEILDITSVSTFGKITTLKEDKDITSLVKKGEYVYATTKDKNLFMCNADNYVELAQTTLETSDNVVKIASSDNGIFCLTDKSEILCYTPGADIIIKYDVTIKEPIERKLSEVTNEQGFPNAVFKEKIYSIHSNVSCNDKYVITSGNGGINIYNKSLKLISSVSADKAGKPFVFGNTMIVLVDGKIISYELGKTEETLEGKQIAELGIGIICADSEKIVSYDNTVGKIEVYLHNGTKVGTLTGCPVDVNKIYYADGFIYCVSSTTVRLYDVDDLADKIELDSNDVLKATFSTTTAISDIEAIGDYLYVATDRGSLAANRIYVYDLTLSKLGQQQSPSVIYRYSSISANKGGKVSALERCGDFLIANAQDAGELQIINIMNAKTPYRESYVLKTNSDAYSFSDIAVSTDRIYGISASGGLAAYDYHSVDIDSLEIVSDGDTKSAKAKIYNQSGNEIDGTLYLAAYSDNKANSLIDLRSVDVTASQGMEVIIDTPSLGLSDYTDVILKAFLFKKGEPLNPLCIFTQSITLSDKGAVTVYVDPNSLSAKEDGSSENPFKTISAAKEYVRAINKQMSGNITVILADGRYELTQPLEFDENDSGFNGYKVIYKAADGATPVISGGKKVRDWTLYDEEKNIYSASVLGVKSRQLIVDGKPAVRARSKGGLTDASHDNGELGIYCYDSQIVNYKKIKDLELVFCGEFFSRRIGVDSVYKLDSSGKTLLVLNRPFWQTSTGFNKYVLPSYIENAYELLDEENEFYLDFDAGVIYYKPYEGIQIENSDVYIPVLEELLVIEGSNYYNKVNNLEFSGIKFTDTTWLRPTDEGGFYAKQAGYYGVPNNFSTGVFTSIFEATISLKLAENISISSCEILNAGGNGLRVLEGVSNMEITKNRIENISGGGIYIGEVNTSNASPWDYRRKISNITVNNNYINNIASEYYSSCAVALGTGQDITIENNEISNTPYTAIHIGWGWDSDIKKNITGMKVSSNYIHNVMKLLGDGAAIYATGITLADKNENPNIISNNYIERVDGSIIFAGSAIYLDTGACGYLIDSNVIDLSENNSAWIPRWGSCVSTDNRFENNFASTARGCNIATNTTVVTNGVWPEEAVGIMNRAGLTK